MKKKGKNKVQNRIETKIYPLAPVPIAVLVNCKENPNSIYGSLLEMVPISSLLQVTISHAGQVHLQRR